MEFKNIYALFFALLGLLFWTLDYFKIGKKPEVSFPVASQKIFILRKILYIVGFMAWLVLGYALMGPRTPLNMSSSPIKVNDIYFVIDVSRSMLADDISPNRLEVAKSKLLQFAAMRSTDRIGIILFSEKVFTLLPLTIDPEIVKGVIQDIRIGYLGSGTNIGDALALAVARGKESATENKVIILLTDGVSNVGNLTPLQAAELAMKEKMKVYAIALGTDDEAKIPMGNGFFGQQYQSIPGGSFDLETLQKIAKMTHGRAFRANSEKALQEIFEEIEKLERTEIKVTNQTVFEEHYYPYLLFSLSILLLIEFYRRFILREVL